MITEHYVQMESAPVVETLVEAVEPQQPPNVCLLADLKEAMFKMRAFTESESMDDSGFGMELGMQRAADMIEHIISRYSEEQDG